MMTIPEMIMYTIVSVLIFGALMGLAWRDGFEQGRSAANRRHVKQWSRLHSAIRDLCEKIMGQDNRIDGIEARLAKLEQPDATVLYANNEPYAAVPDIKPEDATSTGYKWRCEPELDDICETCKRKNTGWCYFCGYDHELYVKDAEKPEDWDCDTCVNDGDMSHLPCKYCNEGSCYNEKPKPLKFDHEPSGEIVGTVVETEDTGRGMRFKISPYDEYTASNVDPTDVLDDAVKPSEEIEVKEET